jgi:hypothetical protein
MSKRSRSTEMSEQHLKQQDSQERSPKRKSLFSTVKTILKKIKSPKVSPISKRTTTTNFENEEIEPQSPLQPKKREQKYFSKSYSDIIEMKRCVSLEIIGETPYFMLPFKKEEFGFATEDLFSDGSFCLDSLDEDHPVLLQMLGLSK